MPRSPARRARPPGALEFTEWGHSQRRRKAGSEGADESSTKRRATRPTFRPPRMSKQNRWGKSGRKKAAPAKGRTDKTGSGPTPTISPGTTLRDRFGRRRLTGQQSEESTPQLLKGRRRRRRTGIQDNIPPSRDSVPAQPKRLPQAALHPVAEDRSSQAHWDRDPQSRLAKPVGTKEDGALGRRPTLPLVINSPKLASAQKPDTFGESLRALTSLHGIKR